MKLWADEQGNPSKPRYQIGRLAWWSQDERVSRAQRGAVLLESRTSPEEREIKLTHNCCRECEAGGFFLEVIGGGWGKKEGRAGRENRSAGEKKLGKVDGAGVE